MVYLLVFVVCLFWGTSFEIELTERNCSHDIFNK